MNAGIVHAHRNGVLTSTTLMANGDAFEDAVRLAKETPSLDIGCHLVLVRGRALSTGNPLPETPMQLIRQLLRKRINIYEELRAQIEKILSVSLKPTHLDTHKHTHIIPAVFQTVVRLACQFNIPFVRLPLPGGRFYRRLANRYNLEMVDHFFGFRLTGSLTERTLATALKNLPEGSTEFMCHPGFCGPELERAHTRLKQSRAAELEALTSPRIRGLIEQEGIVLGGFDVSHRN